MRLYDLDARDEINKSKIFGLSIGIVTNNKDPENLGRIKLKLPLRECVNETVWARVATFMAGKDMGAYFLPEVGDEVLVAFLEGDVSKPFVIGALWNSVDTPPLKNDDGKNNIRKIKSRNGHEIILDDEEGKESLEIKTKAGHVLKMEDGSTNKIQLKDKSGNNLLEIDGQNNQVSIKGNMKISLEAGSCKLTIDSTQNSVSIESGMQMKLKAQMIDIEAGANLNIKSSGMLNLKGSMVKIN